METKTTINGNAAGEYYPLQDTLYRTLALTDDGGTIVETYDYDAYGNTLIFTAAGTGADWWADDAVQGSNPTCEFLFTGRRFDSEKKNYQFRWREYGPEWARFLQRDLVPSAAPYVFANSHPTRATDPLGLFPCTCDCKKPGMEPINDTVNEIMDKVLASAA
jgi:RHS repeat-associated protein